MATRRSSAGPQLDEWSTREKLVLACSVMRSGDQNWHSVSRTIKPICEMVTQRPPEWFSQKNCAYQYGALLDSAETPKRKRTSNETGRQETPQEQILRKLTFERIEELKKSIKQDHERYKKIKKDIERIRSGKINDQLNYIWSQLQSGKNVPIEELIQDPIGDNNSKASLGSPQQQPSPNTSHRSRSQRVPKATERFQAFQAQLQKQQQRYQQQHQGPGGPSQPSSSAGSTPSQMSPTESERPPLPTSSATDTSPVNPPLKLALPLTSPAPEDAFQQQQEEQQEQPPKQQKQQEDNEEQDVLHHQQPLREQQHLQQQQQQQQQQPTQGVSPRKVDGPVSQAEAESPFLSSLLTTPREEVRNVPSTKQEEQVSQQALTTEIQVEKTVPIMSVPKENLIVYRSISQPASPDGPISVSAPTLSKLLEGKTSHSSVAKDLPKTQPEDKDITKDGETAESSKRKLSQSDEIEVVEVPPKKRPAETKPSSDPSPDASTPKSPVRQPTSPSPSPSPSLPTQKPKVMEELTISVGEPPEVPCIPSPRGSKVKKNRGRPRKQGLIRKAAQPLRIMDHGEVDETLSVDDDISERDDTESEAASVTDKEFLEHDQDEESRSAAEDDDAKYAEDSNDAVRLPSFGKARSKPQPLTPSSISPSSPALSTGSSGMDPEASQAQKNWRKSIMLVWKAAASHKYANVFLHPVTDDEAPGYHTIVYRPMDLATIKKNIENGSIRTTSEFQRDMMLMFQNALMYNRSDHDVYHMAEEMRDDVMEQIQYFIATQLHLMEQSNDKDARMLRGHRSDVFHFFL